MANPVFFSSFFSLLRLFAGEVLFPSPMGGQEQLTHSSLLPRLLSFFYIIKTNTLLSFTDTGPRRSHDPSRSASTQTKLFCSNSFKSVLKCRVEFNRKNTMKYNKESYSIDQQFSGEINLSLMPQQ